MAVLERTLDPLQGAGRRVAQEIHELLTGADVGVGELDEIVVGVGPGGFTGLRIGIATALGLGQALAVPVRGVASIEALALGIAAVAPGALLMPVIDARRTQVFAAVYRVGVDGGLVTVLEPHATSAEDLAARIDGLAAADMPAYAAGDGVHRLAGVALSNVAVLPDESPAHDISAVRLAERARAGGARPASPLYLRLPDAEVTRRRRAHEAAGGTRA